MTKLISPYPGISVYKNKYGQIIGRAKPGPNKKMKTHPAYQRLREHRAVFCKAASSGKMIRHIFCDWVKNIRDGQLLTRLSSQLMTIIKSGIHENRMDPQLTNGDLSLLDGFQFNAKAGIYSAFFGHWSLSLENNNRHIHLSIPSFTPLGVIHNPNGGCSHFKLIPVIASLNPRSGEYTLVKGNQGEPGHPVAIDSRPHSVINLETDIVGKDEWIVMVALGIEFYWQTRENEWSPVAAGGHNALDIIKTCKVCAN